LTTLGRDDRRARRGAAELALDGALALTLLGGAARQLARALEAGSLASTGALGLLASLLPSVIAGVLVAAREPARGAGGREIAAALPSLALPLSLPIWVPSPARWPAAHVLAFAAGAVVTCWSLAALGRSFAVLPARRTIVARGPYRLVRHPAYTGELVMWTAACAMLDLALAVALVVAGVLTLRLRIAAEERVLADDPLYRAYAARVRGRLVPALPWSWRSA
jgi:protein-S-isoprenylcysteine O-methyltransferase Ste14